MKISVVDLKKALQWIEVHSKDTHVQTFEDGRQMFLDVVDNYGAKVTIILYDEGTLLPKIQKQDYL